MSLLLLFRPFAGGVAAPDAIPDVFVIPQLVSTVRVPDLVACVRVPAIERTVQAPPSAYEVGPKVPSEVLV